MGAAQPEPALTTPAVSTPGSSSRDPEPSTGRYLYCVSRGLDPQTLADVPGLQGRPLELVEQGELVAVVSTVSLAAFGAESLRRNLEDLAWLAETVQAHDAVVHAVAAHAPTAPMRLATVCFDDDGVRARLNERYVPLVDVLDRVQGCAEWSVKVLAPPPDEPADEPTGERPSGVEYLRRKRDQAARRLAADEDGAATADAVHAALAERSRAGRQLPPQDPRLSGHRGTMLLNAAYLVADEDADAFTAVVAELQADHPSVALDVRGPWPPYSFASLDQP